MHSQFHRIRTEVINRLQNGIKHKGSKERISRELLQDLSIRLNSIEDQNIRKSIINEWYGDLLSADKIRKHHLLYQEPNLTRELSVALNSLTVNFKKRFQTYII